MSASFAIGSLFSGIGGLELGLERGLGSGARVVWQVEQNEFCRAVLAKHWPDATRYEDVRHVGRSNLAPVDVLCGGFPCQDVSDAGLRVGIGGARSGLWTEYARIIRELRPRYVVVENVAGLLARGMGRVLGDLAEVGYDAEWSMLSACAVGAPHARERVFVVAYPTSERPRQLRRIGSATPRPSQRHLRWPANEPAVERMAHGVRDRSHRVTACGNAVVPDVAELVGGLIAEHAAADAECAA